MPLFDKPSAIVAFGRKRPERPDFVRSTAAPLPLQPHGTPAGPASTERVGAPPLAPPPGHIGTFTPPAPYRAFTVVKKQPPPKE